MTVHTLLLADDSVTIQRVIELTFADEDVRVVAVSTGEQAIAAMETETPDIVLADVDMPGPNGYEVARFIRATPRLARTHILLLAGAFEPIDREQAAAAGCDGVLVKPFEPQQVIARVRELLALPGGAQAGGMDARDRGDSVAVAAGESSPPAPAAVSVDEYFERLDHALGGTDARVPETSFGPATAAVPAAGTGAVSPSSAPPMPSIADAFAVFLAAEEAGGAGSSGWPARVVVPDVLIEEVVRRVLERLSTTAVQATVADVVSGTAERLVREEIERLKAAIDDLPAE